MKKLSIAVLAIAAVFSANSHAASDTATAGGTVIVPIQIADAANLSFGKFAPGAGGSVTVSTSGARTGTGVILSTIGSSPSAARFDVTGDANATYDISITAPATVSDGTNTMALATFSDLTAANATTGNVTSGTLSAGGTQSIYIGGTLTVGATQAAGAYTGNISVTVEYN